LAGTGKNAWRKSRGAPERLKGVEKEAGRFYSRGVDDALPKRVGKRIVLSNGKVRQLCFHGPLSVCSLGACDGKNPAPA
jgi:hypothetical protein